MHVLWSSWKSKKGPHPKFIQPDDTTHTKRLRSQAVLKYLGRARKAWVFIAFSVWDSPLVQSGHCMVLIAHWHQRRKHQPFPSACPLWGRGEGETLKLPAIRYQKVGSHSSLQYITVCFNHPRLLSYICV